MIWDNDDAFFNTDPGIDDHLDAAVLLYGAYDYAHFLSASNHHLDENLVPYFSLNPELRYTKGNPIANVANITTPVILFHGTQDNSIHYMQSVVFHDSLIAHGKVSELHVGDWAHLYDEYNNFTSLVFSTEGLKTKDTVLAFLEKYVLTPVAVTDERELPIEYVLAQNYPNPFNPSTTIEFALPNAGYVTLTVHNVLGQEVAKLIAGDHAAGNFNATWDASEMPSGVYFYRLTAGEYIQTKRAVLMK
jgi:hypothetical protein